MKKHHSIKLIEGEFTPSQTRSVLLELIGNKIRYHTLEAFSIKERFNGDVSCSEKRVAELKEASAQVEEILRYSSEKGLNLNIESFIDIKFVEEEAE